MLLARRERELADAESGLQQANFERNRLKETISCREEFSNLRMLVEKLQKMVLLRGQNDQFSESEVVVFR